MGDKTPLWIDQRERDTIIAALRFWQRFALAHKVNAGDEMEIAQSGRSGDDAHVFQDEVATALQQVAELHKPADSPAIDPKKAPKTGT